MDADDFEADLKKAEEKYKRLQEHLVKKDLGQDLEPLLDQHLTSVREEIVDLQIILGIFNAN